METLGHPLQLAPNVGPSALRVEPGTDKLKANESCRVGATDEERHGAKDLAKPFLGEGSDTGQHADCNGIGRIRPH
eukprot:3171577-Lingulodinium_polyedra.AAC.1